MEKKEQSRGSLKEEMAELEEVTRGKSPIQHKLSSKRDEEEVGNRRVADKTRQER